ncbi:MAG: phosphopantothenoylcysteine decarboxylase [Planctomycetaceae bacterium]
MKLLVTAGPTREYLDDVRFLTNASSGRMGHAIADAALAAGHQVVLVRGPVSLPPVAGCRQIDVETTREMWDACAGEWPDCDGLIATAAVCDYRPRDRARGKLKKTGSGLRLDLVETEDILASLAARKGPRFVVGFALEVAADRSNAVTKLRSKNCDAIVLNAPSALNGLMTQVELIVPPARTIGTWSGSKRDVADRLIAWIGAEFGAGSTPQ